MSRQGGLRIERMGHLAQVSRAGFYRSLQEAQPVEEEMMVRAEIQQIALAHRRRYGYRRITPSESIKKTPSPTCESTRSAWVRCCFASRLRAIAGASA
jgi:hypothetical protein